MGTVGVHSDHPLYGSFLKLAVAYDKTVHLRRAIKAAADGFKLPSRGIKYNPKTGKHTVFLDTGRMHNPVWAVWVGEICHNLRSALDGLIYQLAILNGMSDADIGTKVKFPIFRYRDDRPIPGTKPVRNQQGFRSGYPPCVSVLDPKHRTLFEKYQPYIRGNGADKSPLWRLHELNNTDKHRLVPVIVFVPHQINLIFSNPLTGKTMAFEGKKTTRMRRLEKGTQIQLPLSGKPVPNMSVKLNLMVDIRFDKGCSAAVRGAGVSATLAKMHAQVERILRDFLPLFPGHATSPPQEADDPYYPVPDPVSPLDNLGAEQRFDPETGTTTWLLDPPLA